MKKQYTYFPRTTVQQRRLLFETWEATGSVKEACDTARGSTKVFYTWKPRFDASGYTALETPYSHAPKHPRTISADVTKRVIEMKHEHPTWGKRRITDELAKSNSWIPLVSPNTVKRILKEADLWAAPDMTNKKKPVNALCGQPTGQARV
jgi:transposase